MVFGQFQGKPIIVVRQIARTLLKQRPDAVKSLGEQIATGAAIAPDDELFEAYDVFSAEMARIFTLPWLAVDHASRLAAPGDFLRADIGSRSVVLVRENEECVHAMRNACLHAGYRVCEEESGRTDRLFCQYHGWYYALDGKLTEPMFDRVFATARRLIPS